MSAFKLIQCDGNGGWYRATTRLYASKSEAYAHAATLHQTDETPIVAVRVRELTDRQIDERDDVPEHAPMGWDGNGGWTW